MKISLSIARSWDEAAWKTADLHPLGAPGFLLSWNPDPWPVDGGIPQPLIAPLAHGLSAVGSVVFCLLWAPAPSVTTLRPLYRPAHRLARAVRGRLTERFLPPLALAEDFAGAAEFLEQGWSTEGQLGFLLTPGTEPDGAMLANLFQRRTWQEFIFPQPVEALIAPPTDGDGVFVAARSEVVLRRLATLFTDNVTAAGFSVATAFRANMQRAHFVLQRTGSIGNSVVAALLGQFYMAAGENAVCIDADPYNQTLSGFKGLKVRPMDIIETSRSHLRLYDELINDILCADAPVIVDVGSAAFVHLMSHMLGYRCFEVISAAGIIPTVHCVVIGGQSMADSIEGFRIVADALPSMCELVIWENDFHGPVHTGQGTPFQSMRVYVERRDRVLGVIRLAAGESEASGNDLHEIINRHLTFAEAADDPAFSTMARLRLGTMWEDYRMQMARIL